MTAQPPPPSVPLPSYSLDELRGDLHHLIQPIIGNLRLAERDHPSDTLRYQIERLQLALALTDVAAGETPHGDLDVRIGRARHGCGYFRNEFAAVKTAMQTGWTPSQNDHSRPDGGGKQ